MTRRRAGDPLAHPVRDYAGVEALLLSRVREDPRPYAARARYAGNAVRALLSRAAVSVRDIRFLHVAGSKGKGSVALMAEHLLLGRGERVGTFTSPHLRRWNERVRLQGEPVSDRTLVEALEELRPHVAALDALSDEHAATFFDLITATALLIFARRECPLVVLETGLGGRFDASNVVIPTACCITSIELEHTDKLGTTLADVAWHKAGIIKAGVPVVTGELAAEAARVVAAQAEELNAPLLRLGRDWKLDARPLRDGTQRVAITCRHPAAPVTATFDLPRPGRHMAVNAGLALLLTRLAGHEVNAAELAGCELPARAQVLARAPWLLVDAAHTAASFKALADTLDAIPAGERRFLVSTSRDKAPDALARLLEGASQVIVTQVDPLRSAPAAALGSALEKASPGLAVVVEPEPAAALARARAGMREDTLLCVCGSVYLAGFVLDRVT